MQKRPSSMPINIERPQSALLRGVRITEYKDHVINPDPIILQETDFLLEEFLSPTKLKALTGVDDLYSVDNLEMIVDTSDTSLGNFGIYLPNLKQLKLSSSFVPRIRDLGTSLGHLKVLWLARSGMTDLDGIPSLTNLQELYLAYNEIQDISPCSMLDNLKVLDLEGNLIDDIRQIEFLSLCSNLVSLTLEGNPICVKPNSETQPNARYNYRHEVSKMLLSLKTLDDEPVMRKEKLNEEFKKEDDYSQHNQCPFDDDWQLINKCLEEGVGPPEEKLAINECRRPGTSSSHGNSPVPVLRPLSAMRPMSSLRPGSALQRRPMSGNRLGTASSGSSANQQRPFTDPVYDITNDASNLTIGPTIYGNPLRGLIARKKGKPATAEVESMSSSSLEKGTKGTKIKNNKDVKTNYEDDTELFKELQSWKTEHERKLEERKKYFEPQVLRIDDYAEPALNEDEDELDDVDDGNNNYEVDDEFQRYENSKTNINERNQNILPSKKSELSSLNLIKKSQDYDSRVSSAASINIPNSSSSNSSIAGSRVATGDSGYPSSISDKSYSSLTLKTSNYSNSYSNLPLHSQQIHQPVIISSNNPNQVQIKSPSVQPSKTGLKQLKGNLAPLSSLKFPKN